MILRWKVGLTSMREMVGILVKDSLESFVLSWDNINVCLVDR